jgi:hypothetical protein
MDAARAWRWTKEGKMAARYSDRFLRNVTILLGLAAMAIGCGPSSLAVLFMPFVDDRIEPKCKLADPKKEITVVVASHFENLEVRPDVQPAAGELAETFANELRKRAQVNKEKIKVVPPLKARPHLAKLKTPWDAEGLLSVGEKLGADYVIALNIQDMALIKPSTFNQLYQGKADIEVTVYDTHQPALESVIKKDPFRSEFPRSRPIDQSECSPLQFRQMFINRIARDLARWFTAYPSDEKFEIDSIQ